MLTIASVLGALIVLAASMLLGASALGLARVGHRVTGLERDILSLRAGIHQALTHLGRY
jgi:hypothetical protein